MMAYTKALEKLTGVEMTKMLPIHRAIYHFSPNNYKEIDKYGAAFTRKMDNNLKKSKTTKLLPSERYSLVFSSVRLYMMPILLQKYD
ncbi:hypothetical protein D3C74_108090 [compost metagenome]